MMGRKSRHRKLKEIEQIRWYQWEFLRRNSRYRRDYDAFMQEFGGWFQAKGFWYDRDIAYRGENWEFFCKVIAPRAQDICRKWQVSDPFSPDWTFDKSGLHEYKSRRHGYPRKRSKLLRAVLGLREYKKCKRRLHVHLSHVYLPTGYSPENATAGWDFLQESLQMTPEELAKAAAQEVDAIRSRTPNQENFDRYVYLKLDVTQAKSELLEKARREIEPRQRAYEKYLERLGRKNAKRPERRRRLDLYDKYLQVWDLRQKGLTFSQIAQKVYPGQHEAHQRVQDHYKRAKKLIEGDYKELR